MFKKKHLLFSIPIFIIGLVVSLIALKSVIIPKEGSGDKRVSLEEFVPSERAVIGKISGGASPPYFIKELVIDPFKVKQGERQIFSIWVKDSQGIEKVVGKIETDDKEEIIEFQLAEGDINEGRWQGFWITRNISAPSIYTIVIKATNTEGKTNSLSPPWHAEN